MDTQTIKQVVMAVKQSPSHQAGPKVPVIMQISNKTTYLMQHDKLRLLY